MPALLTIPHNWISVNTKIKRNLGFFVNPGHKTICLSMQWIPLHLISVPLYANCCCTNWRADSTSDRLLTSSWSVCNLEEHCLLSSLLPWPSLLRQPANTWKPALSNCFARLWPIPESHPFNKNQPNKCKLQNKIVYGLFTSNWFVHRPLNNYNACIWLNYCEQKSTK